MTILKEPVVDKVDKLRKAACRYDCVLCGRDKQYTVPAHCNEQEFGKGVGKKTVGFLLAYICDICHDLIDGRRGGLQKNEKRDLWRTAYLRTVWIWFRDGLVKVT